MEKMHVNEFRTAQNIGIIMYFLAQLLLFSVIYLILGPGAWIISFSVGIFVYHILSCVYFLAIYIIERNNAKEVVK